MRTSRSIIALSIALLAACDDDSNPGPGSGATQSTDSGVTSGGSPSTGGTSSTTGGAGGGSAGPGGASGAQGGAAAGTSSGGPAGTGGAPGNAAAQGGSAGGSSAGAGGSSAGSGDGGTPSAGGNDAGSTAGCTRELLKATVENYFKALAAHDPAMLPLADNVKFTENGKALELGEAGLWTTAGALKHVHSALDTETCQAASQAVVPDGTMDIPVALRLKLQNQKLTEIETIAVRPGDYTALGSPFPSNTSALAASAMSVKWEEPVPAAQRNTRAEITGWIDKYFRMFPRGVCNIASGCKRIENGGGNFNCSLGASCAAGQPGPSDNAMEARALMADVETGVGVGFTMFMGNTDMHMYKMYGGQIYEVSAILGRADSSGWD
jgi:hypothetical protein